LPYSGFMAEKDIDPGSQLIRVPRECLLTTRVAYLSDIKKVFQQNTHFFHKKFNDSWEDHILLFFILYEFQKSRNSQWFNLIRNLPKELDYVIFWDDRELDLLEDKKLVNEAKKLYKDFLIDYE
jgi:hypothetical protein